MPVRSPNTKTGAYNDTRQFLVAGGAAGALLVTGIKTNDVLLSVTGIKNGGGAPLNLLSEFTISAAGTIDNTGGTSTVGYDVLVLYWSAPSQLG